MGCFLLSPPPLTFWRLWLALPPLLSINQFKSNKCGIFSRTVCIPLVWLWKVVFVMRCVCAFVFSLIAFCLLQPEAAPSTLWPFLTLWFPSSFHCSSSPSFQRFIPVMTHHNFWFGNVIVGKRNRHWRPSLRTTGFYVWHNKDAPQKTLSSSCSWWFFSGGDVPTFSELLPNMHWSPTPIKMVFNKVL